MLKKLQEEKNNKEYFSISGDIYIRENGDFLACSYGRNYFVYNFVKGNIDEMSTDEVYQVIIKLLTDSLNRDNLILIDGTNDKIDYIYEWEKQDYKKDKCKSSKRINISIKDIYPNFLVIVDGVCLKSHCWGGGRFVHLMPLDTSSKEEIVQKLRDIHNYKNGHLPGASDEEKNKYRVIKR